ncbi:MAG: HD domain-containing protein [Gammaproteobacteria bacterium]|nr:HD domain-containing protein [Gammaproteobacteria bacterium]
MDNTTTAPQLPDLFSSCTPDQAWNTATEIIQRISPSYDFSSVRRVFDDTVRLFEGTYPGYCTILTPYHDLQHTLDVFLCAVRLMHGVHLAGERIDDTSITLLCIGALLHDIGYAQREGEASGTGAQYTRSHIERGIEFIRHYLTENGFPAAWPEQLAGIVRSTSFERLFPMIDFPDQRTRLIGQILGSADLVGQMADRTYLEKLLLLYLEFQEAQFGNYQSMYDLLARTREFHEYTMVKLNEDFGGLYTRLTNHFMDYMGIEKNFYLESIDKNLAYLSQVVALDEENYLSMLKRDSVLQKVRNLAGQQ